MKQKFLSIGTTIAVLAGFLFPTANAYAIYVQYFTANPDTIYPGGSSAIRVHCQDQDGIMIYNYPVYGGYPYGNMYAGGGEDVTLWVSPGATTQYWVACGDNRVSNTVYAYGGPLTLNVIQPDNCPATPTTVANGIQVPPGTYHITAQGNNFCVTNYSGKYVFVPTASAAEVNTFKAATQGYLSATIVYFARAAGY